jgi:hypothetical protein
LAKHGLIIWRQNDTNRVMPEFNTKLYNGDIPAARGNTSEDGHCEGEFLLAWSSHEKEISHGKVGSAGHP